MPFPLIVQGQEFASGPQLTHALERSVEAGQRELIEGLVQEALSPAERRGLAAALIQRPSAAAVVTGAYLATRWADPALGPLLLAALAGHDLALLLCLDPLGPSSVEDALLRATTAVADLSQAPLRAELLRALRHAGLPELELSVLERHGTPSELRCWLPAILSEPLDPPLQARAEALAEQG